MWIQQELILLNCLDNTREESCGSQKVINLMDLLSISPRPSQEQVCYCFLLSLFGIPLCQVRRKKSSAWCADKVRDMSLTEQREQREKSLSSARAAIDTLYASVRLKSFDLVYYYTAAEGWKSSAHIKSVKKTDPPWRSRLPIILFIVHNPFLFLWRPRINCKADPHFSTRLATMIAPLSRNNKITKMWGERTGRNAKEKVTTESQSTKAINLASHLLQTHVMNIRNVNGL